METEIQHFFNGENNYWSNAWRLYALVVSKHFRPFGSIGSILYSWLKHLLHFRQTPPKIQLNFELQINREKDRSAKRLP